MGLNALLPAGLLTDWDMEAAGTAAWIAINNATLTKEAGSPSGFGSQVLRIAYTDTNYPQAAQYLDPSMTYRVRGWARGQTAGAIPNILSNSVSYWTGLASTDWQYFDFTMAFGAAEYLIRLRNVSVGSGAVEFDDVSVVVA